jgi:hypothetical protein
VFVLLIKQYPDLGKVFIPPISVVYVLNHGEDLFGRGINIGYSLVSFKGFSWLLPGKYFYAILFLDKFPGLGYRWK